MQAPNTLATDSLAQMQCGFTAVVGRIEGHAHNRLRYLHGDERDEAVEEVRAIAWKMYRQLWIEGRNPDEMVGGIAVFAVKQVRSGGRLVGQEPVNDLMSKTARHGHGHSVGPIPPPREPVALEFIDALSDDGGSPAELACFRLDLRKWLAGLDERPRAVAEQLLSGLNSAEVAPLHRVTRTMIWHIRQALRESYEEFFGEEG